MKHSPWALSTMHSISVACPECTRPIGERCAQLKGQGDRSKSHSARRKLADEQRTQRVNPKTMKPFFTPSPEPIPPEYYHNVPGRDGIFDINKLRTHDHGCGFPHLDGKCLRDTIKHIATTPGYHLDLDPPSYLPAREPLPPRACDVCKQPIKDYGCECMPF
jgi:hypothetical protein